MSNPDGVVVVSLTVVTSDSGHITKASEIFARAAAGMVLDGIDVSLTFGMPSDEEIDQ